MNAELSLPESVYKALRALSYEEKNKFCLALERGNFPDGWDARNTTAAVIALEYMVFAEYFHINEPLE